MAPLLNDVQICHIVHIDRLSSIINDGYIWCDQEVLSRNSGGTTIGMSKIKKRRLEELTFENYPDLYVGECVPFYFCPRSVMLYMFHMGNHPDISYNEGQEPIVHLVSHLAPVVEWAESNDLRWVFTDSNAGSYYFNDYNNLEDLVKINWEAIKQKYWSDVREEKQSEFLIEKLFPWQLIERVGVYSDDYGERVNRILDGIPSCHKPEVETRRDWYY